MSLVLLGFGLALVSTSYVTRLAKIISRTMMTGKTVDYVTYMILTWTVGMIWIVSVR